MRFLSIIFVVLALAVGCTPATETVAVDGADPTVAPASTPTPTLVPTPVPEPTLEPTSLPTATAAPTPTPVPPTPAPPTPVPPTPVPPTPRPIPEPTATVAPTATAEADPEPTPTEEPDPGKEDLPPANYTGEVKAIRTQGGAVVAVRGESAAGYEVVTPCYELATLRQGLMITGPIDVLIDPGHGGDESGAVGPNGLKESTVNLLVAEELRALLIERGYTVELTRYSDVRVAIQSRAELANALAPTVFMSIHHNGGFPEPFPVAGTEVFVQLNDDASARLGGLVFEEIQAAFADIDAAWMGNEETHGVAWRKNDEGTDLYGVLRRTPNLVSVLTEAMFISTEAEANLLAQPEIRTLEAVALADALDRWFETDDPGEGFIEGIVFQGDLGNGGGTDGCVDPDL